MVFLRADWAGLVVVVVDRRIELTLLLLLYMLGMVCV
jgi:hypothetical protein